MIERRVGGSESVGAWWGKVGKKETRAGDYLIQISQATDYDPLSLFKAFSG